MSRLAMFNMAFGFTVLSLAAAAGSFISFEITDGYLYDESILSSWQLLLKRSAHGHANLFAMLHILFALTLSYSRATLSIKKLQTMGLVSGTLAMSAGLMLRGAMGPVAGIDFTEIMMGVLLTGALLAIGSHAAHLWAKFRRI